MYSFNKIIAFVENVKTFFERLKGNFSCKSAENEVDYPFQRKFVADLILKVLTHQLLVREALLKFPCDTKDISLQAAWHALCHLEADEDLRRRDFDYAQEQDDFLELIAFTLQKGDELPENITKAYENYHSEALIPHSKGLKGLIQKLTRFINL